MWRMATGLDNTAIEQLFSTFFKAVVLDLFHLMALKSERINIVYLLEKQISYNRKGSG
jgi:hypothetical protein